MSRTNYTPTPTDLTERDGFSDSLGHRLPTQLEVATARAEEIHRELCADRSRLRRSDLWLVTKDGPGVWTATHREQERRFCCRRHAQGTLAVESDSGSTYLTTLTGCTCLDHQNRKRQCLHMAAAVAVAESCRKKAPVAHTGEAQPASAPAPVKSWETPEYHALKAEMLSILG